MTARVFPREAGEDHLGVGTAERLLAARVRRACEAQQHFWPRRLHARRRELCRGICLTNLLRHSAEGRLQGRVDGAEPPAEGQRLQRAAAPLQPVGDPAADAARASRALERVVDSNSFAYATGVVISLASLLVGLWAGVG